MDDLVTEVLEFPASGPPLPSGASARWGCLRFHHHGNTSLPFGNSVDERQLLVAHNHELLVLDRDTGLPRKLLRTSFAVGTSIFPEPGVALLTGSGATGPVHLWRHQSDQVSLVTTLGARVDAMVMSADGRRVAFALRGRRIALMEWPSRRVTQEIERDPADLLSLALSDDGSRLAVLARTRYVSG